MQNPRPRCVDELENDNVDLVQNELDGGGGFVAKGSMPDERLISISTKEEDETETEK